MNTITATNRFNTQLFTVVLILVILYFGRVLFIPLFFSALISCIAYPVCRMLEQRKVPPALAIAISMLLCLAPVVAVFFIVCTQLVEINHYLPLLSQKLVTLLNSTQLPGFIKDNIGEKQFWIKSFFSGGFGSLYEGIASSLSSVVMLVTIPFYVALILHNRRRLLHGIYLVLPRYDKAEIRKTLLGIITAYHNFIKGMALVYLLVAILNITGLYLLGIPNAIAFGFIASILTFIPYVGILIGSVLPVTIAWLTYGSIYYPLGVIGVFAVVQLLEANVIFPLAVGYRIKLNTLATLITIFLGGIIWGAAGMILFIPFAFILKLLAEKIEALKPFAVLLGDEELQHISNT